MWVISWVARSPEGALVGELRTHGSGSEIEDTLEVLQLEADAENFKQDLPSKSQL